MLAVYRDVELCPQFEWTTVRPRDADAAPCCACNDNIKHGGGLGFHRAIVAALAIAIVFWGVVGAALRYFL